MKKVQSCGILLFRRKPTFSFLLMKHSTRYDLPKGHREAGESEIECALREFTEETGIGQSNIELDADFRYDITYYPKYKRFGGETVEKTVTYFLGWLKKESDIKTTEHKSFQWVHWNPPHSIQKETVDTLLAKAEEFFSNKAD